MENFEEMLKESLLDAREGLQKGVVVRKTNDGVLIDIKGKAEKFVSRREFSDAEWEGMNFGTELDVVVEEGKASFSKARKLSAWLMLKENFESGQPVEIRITKQVKGGYVGEFRGVEIFVPGSMSGRNEQVEEGKRFNAVIKNLDESDSKVVCSIADYESIARGKKLEEFCAAHQPGEDLAGKVRNIIDRGVFVDLGGVDGFIPFSELTYRRIKNPRDILSIGDSVTVKVIGIDGAAGKITLSRKALEERPWDSFSSRFKEGDRVEGTVRNLIEAGVFVEILDGVDGFIHVSEISWKERVKHPEKYFKTGDVVTCLIKKIDNEKRKISLSFREVSENPWKTFIDAHAVGTVVKVKVKEVMDRGLVLELPGEIEGFIPNDNVSWTKVKKEKTAYKAGDELSVKFMEADMGRRRLIFSIKDLYEDPWNIAASRIKEGDEVEGTVSGMSERSIFFEILPNVEGVARKDEFMKGRNELSIKEGDKLQLLVKLFDPDSKKLQLSHRDLHEKREREAYEEFKKSNETKSTLGDFFKTGSRG